MLKDYLNEILQACVSEFGISIEDIRSDCRKQEFVYCRKAFCIIIKEKLDLKYETIGRMINRSINQVSVSISKQPTDNYYIFCLTRIRHKVDIISFI